MTKLEIDEWSCKACGSMDAPTEHVTDTLDGHTVLEREYRCAACKIVVNYWAHGNWQLEDWNRDPQPRRRKRKKILTRTEIIAEEIKELG